MNRIEAACIKSGIPFEKDRVSEIIEGIIALTKKVNGRLAVSVEPQQPAAKSAFSVPQDY
jgi:hypothetical protein